MTGSCCHSVIATLPYPPDYKVAYLSRVPVRVPVGRIVVHNHVKPAHWLGVRGFRAWLAEPGPPYVPCGCGWAPHLEQHYRVRFDQGGKSS